MQKIKGTPFCRNLYALTSAFTLDTYTGEKNRKILINIYESIDVNTCSFEL